MIIVYDLAVFDDTRIGPELRCSPASVLGNADRYGVRTVAPGESVPMGGSNA